MKCKKLNIRNKEVDLKYISGDVININYDNDPQIIYVRGNNEMVYEVAINKPVKDLRLGDPVTLFFIDTIIPDKPECVSLYNAKRNSVYYVDSVYNIVSHILDYSNLRVFTVNTLFFIVVFCHLFYMIPLFSELLINFSFLNFVQQFPEIKHPIITSAILTLTSFSFIMIIPFLLLETLVTLFIPSFSLGNILLRRRINEEMKVIGVSENIKNVIKGKYL